MNFYNQFHFIYPQSISNSRNGSSSLVTKTITTNQSANDLLRSNSSNSPDANPKVILKKSSQQMEKIKEFVIKYLRSETPTAPSDSIIRQEDSSLITPAPLIHQQPPRPATPEPILPLKPQSVTAERWLSYTHTKRKVILQREDDADSLTLKPRNVIVQWEAPSAIVVTKVNYLGVDDADPSDYVAKFGASLKAAKDLPQFVLDVKTPDGLELAAESKFNGVHELEGDVSALNFVDLDAEGLSAYRAYLQSLNSKES